GTIIHVGVHNVLTAKKENSNNENSFDKTSSISESNEPFTDFSVPSPLELSESSHSSHFLEELLLCVISLNICSLLLLILFLLALANKFILTKSLNLNFLYKIL